MELVTQPEPGHHNANLLQSRSRIIEGATWKRQRIVVMIPSAKMISAKVALSIWNLAFPPNQAVVKVLVLGHEVGKAYSDAIGQVLDHPEIGQWEYVLTLETDNVVPHDLVVKLLRRMEANPHLSCVGGLYWTKGPGGVPQQWGDPTDPVLNFRPLPPQPGQLVECCGTGMGANLWRMSMFRDMREKMKPAPLFETKFSEAGAGTQDLSFWTEARKYGYRCAVDNDCLVGHYDHEGKYGPAEFTW